VQGANLDPSVLWIFCNMKLQNWRSEPEYFLAKLVVFTEHNNTIHRGGVLILHQVAGAAASPFLSRPLVHRKLLVLYAQGHQAILTPNFRNGARTAIKPLSVSPPRSCFPAGSRCQLFRGNALRGLICWDMYIEWCEAKVGK
jgi:hypothetical protein